MGLDVSFHPVPVELIQSRLLPYVAGEGDIDELVADAVRIAKVRHRAHGWGMAVLRAQDKLLKQQEKKKDKRPSAWLKKFDQNLHVLGRPFFITLERPDQISRAIDHYLKTTPDAKGVDALATQMVGNLDEALAEKLEPVAEEKLPSSTQLAKAIRQDMDMFREAYLSLGKKKKVKVLSGEFTPQELFTTFFPQAILKFAAHFRPGWIASGEVWPTWLIHDSAPYFQSIASLLAPLDGRIPTDHFPETLTDRYSVGGYIPPDKVTDFRIFLEEKAAQYSKGPNKVDFQKILEAVMDAEREFMGFTESAGIYSGAMGMN